jgi:hypothetical protein
MIDIIIVEAQLNTGWMEKDGADIIFLAGGPVKRGSKTTEIRIGDHPYRSAGTLRDIIIPIPSECSKSPNHSETGGK